MSHNYDNWERLVRAVLLREELIEIALRDSRDPSTISDDGSSSSSNYDLSIGSNSSFPNQAHVNIHGEKRDQLIPMDYSDLTMNHTDWKAMLPPGENEVVWKSASLSFSLDKMTGKNCFMVGPRGLAIPEADHDLISDSQSRFSEVAEIKSNSEQTYIKCSIETQRLSPDTIYGAYLVFKLGTLPSPSDVESDDHVFLNDLHKELHSLHLFLTFNIRIIKLSEDGFAANFTKMQGYNVVQKRTITTKELNIVDRANGWKEVEIENLYVEGKEKEEVRVELDLNKSLEAHLKGCLIVEGIEFRPTYRRSHLFGSFRQKTIKEKQNKKKSLDLKVEVDSEEDKRKAMEVVSAVAGVEYVYMNKKEMKLTVVGIFDAREVLTELRKWHMESFRTSNKQSFFSLDKRTGKQCFMVGPRGLEIPKANHKFISYSQSRFSEVVEIKYNSQAPTYIGCSIETQRLSPDTIYGAYLVFKLEKLTSPSDESEDDLFLYYLHNKLHWLHLFLEYVVATICLYEDEFADEMQGHKRILKKIVTTRELNVADRGNGWKEVEIGNLYVEGKNKGEVMAEFYKTFLDGRLKGQLPIVEGIEFRPTCQRSQLLGSFRSKTIKEKESQKITIELKVEVANDTEKKKAMQAVSTLAGVEYVYMDMKEMKLTVAGDVDTGQVLKKLRKSWQTQLLISYYNSQITVT